MAAVYVTNLVIASGTTFSQTFNLVESDDSGPLDLEGFTVEAQFRKHAGSSTKNDFTTTVSNAAQGQIILSLAPDKTSTLKPGRYVYDIVITNAASEKTRVVEGSVLLREGVTR
tara:strand:+ start:9229 stop:9570 length:342 start_codon:yes stop_codon:yes gene_type:complete